MKRATVLLGLALLAAGCGGSPKPTAEAPDPGATAGPAGKPTPDEVKACLAAHLDQCGWKNVELARVADGGGLPKGVPAPGGEAWAFVFTAHYTDLLGDRQTSADWVAVVARADGKPCVKGCYDAAGRLVGGHQGTETTSIADLAPMPVSADVAPIVAPNP